jgi:predicted naringenin-chalcone synthase
MKTGCRAITNCLERGGLTARALDFLVVCTSTGYVCPDVGSRFIAHMGFRDNLQRGSMLALGCAQEPFRRCNGQPILFAPIRLASP